MPVALARKPALRALIFAVLAACAAPSVAADEAPPKEPDSDFWWWIRGFEITPGVGLRTLSLDVHSKANDTRGNLSNNFGPGWLFGSVNIESPSFQFGKSDFGFSVYAYAANVRLNEQFVDDPGQDPNSDSSSGSRHDVGTSVSGYYSYLVPALHWRKVLASGGQFKIAAGYGRWSGRFSGDIILTPDNQPAAGLPKTTVDTRFGKNAYLVNLQYKFANHWQLMMSVGGPKWQDGNFRYQLEETSITLGYTFVL